MIFRETRLEEHVEREYTPNQRMIIQRDILRGLKPEQGQWEVIINEAIRCTRPKDRLPSPNVLRDSLTAELEPSTDDKAKIVRVPCDTCHAYGLLRWKVDWDRIRKTFPDEEGLLAKFKLRFGDRAEEALAKWNASFEAWKQDFASTPIIEIACGCENTSKDMKEDSKFNDYPREERMKAYNIHLAQRAEKRKERFTKTHTSPPWTKKQLTDRGYAFLGDFYRMDHTNVLDAAIKRSEEDDEYIL